MRAALNVALDAFIPERTIAQVGGIALVEVGAPGNGFRTPAMRQVVEAAFPGPDAGRSFKHRAQKIAGVLHLVHVEGCQHRQFLELDGAVASRLAEIEAFAASGLQLVDLLFVLRKRRHVDLDARSLLEVRDDRIGEFVRPHQQVQLARRRQGIAAVERCREAHGAEGGSRLQQRAARQRGGSHGFLRRCQIGLLHV